jgi:hypothetical protein
MSGSLLVLGLDATTALGSRLGEATPVAAPAGLERAIGDSTGPVGIIVGGAGDTVALTRAAVATGRPVLVEAVGRIDAAGVTELAGSQVYAGLRRRFESDVRWARGRVAAGGAGLTWAIHAEALASRAPDATTEALDLLDAATALAGCAPLSATRFDRARGVPATWVLTLDHCATGQLVVRLADTRSRRAGGPELAAIRLLASHGLVAADLDGPIQRTFGRRGSSIDHVGADGAGRLLAAFKGVVEGTGGPAPVALGSLADLLRVLDGPTRRTRTA